MAVSNRAVPTFPLGLALAASGGCSDDNIALVGRETLPARAGFPVQDDLVATAERINASSSENHFGAISGRPSMITYA